jgi:viroplasmin and RNaseH domain-containing protein
LNLRNFAATQTKGVSCSIYKKYPTKDEAEVAYREAERDGFVEIL